MKIQQHDGVVVEATVISAGLRQAQREEKVLRGESEAPRTRVRSPPPSLYRGPRGGRPPRDWISRGGGGQGGWLAPQAGWGAPTPRLSNPRRRGRPKGGAPAHQGLVHLPLQPMEPSGVRGPTRWTPGTLPVVPVQYR